MSYWFRPKYYGYGATPVNWKGWLATVLFAALIYAVILVSAGLPLSLRLGASAVLVVLFTWIVWKKTNGAWRWRWGGDESDK